MGMAQLEEASDVQASWTSAQDGDGTQFHDDAFRPTTSSSTVASFYVHVKKLTLPSNSVYGAD